MTPRSALEERVYAAAWEARDELVGLTSELVACDTTAREVGDAPRDEEKLQRLLARRLRALGAQTDLWEPEPTGSGNRHVLRTGNRIGLIRERRGHDSESVGIAFIGRVAGRGDGGSGVRRICAYELWHHLGDQRARHDD